MKDFETFKEEVAARMSHILTHQSEEENAARKQLSDAKSALAKATEEAENATTAADLKALKAANQKIADAQLAVDLYQKHMEMVLNNTSPVNVMESKVLAADAAELKNAKCQEAYDKIIDLLSQVERTGHDLLADLEEIDSIAATWNKNICKVPGLTAGRIDCNNRGIPLMLDRILLLAPYRRAHGHNESSYTGSGFRWTLYEEKNTGRKWGNG